MHKKLISDFSRTPRMRTGSWVAVVAGCAACACGTARASGGAVSGKVEATPVKFLEETVVYLKYVAGTYPARTASLDQKGKVFIPHVLVVTQGDTVEFLNHDSIAHNVFSPDHETYNLGTFKPDEKRTYTFKRAGAYAQLCSLHPEMLAYIFVAPNPYASIIDEAGRFTIEGIPPGKYEITVWNSNLKAPPQSVTVKAGGTAAVSFTLHR